jgi:hypothetical protein
MVETVTAIDHVKDVVHTRNGIASWVTAPSGLVLVDSPGKDMISVTRGDTSATPIADIKKPDPQPVETKPKCKHAVPERADVETILLSYSNAATALEYDKTLELARDSAVEIWDKMVVEVKRKTRDWPVCPVSGEPLSLLGQEGTDVVVVGDDEVTRALWLDWYCPHCGGDDA